MMSRLQSPAQLSIAEFLELPETKPASEYIDGAIYQKPMLKVNTADYKHAYLLKSIEPVNQNVQPVHLPNYTVPLEVAQLFQI